MPPQAYTREMLSQAYLWLQQQPESIRMMAQTPDQLVGLYLRSRRTGFSSLESAAPVSTESFRSQLKTLSHEVNNFNGADQLSLPTDSRSDARTEVRVEMRGDPRAPPQRTTAPSANHPEPQVQHTVVNSNILNTTALPQQSSNSYLSQNQGPSGAIANPSQQNSQYQAPKQLPLIGNPFPPYVPPPVHPPMPSFAVSDIPETTPSKALQPTARTDPQIPTGLDLDPRSREILRDIKGKMNLSSDQEALRLLISLGYERLKSL